MTAHPSPIVQHVLHFEVVKRVRTPELDVSVSLVAGEARGVECDEAVAHGPILDGGMQDARVSENDHLRGTYYQVDDTRYKAPHVGQIRSRYILFTDLHHLHQGTRFHGSNLQGVVILASVCPGL